MKIFCWNNKQKTVYNRKDVETVMINFGFWKQTSDNVFYNQNICSVEATKNSQLSFDHLKLTYDMAQMLTIQLWCN